MSLHSSFDFDDPMMKRRAEHNRAQCERIKHLEACLAEHGDKAELMVRNSNQTRTIKEFFEQVASLQAECYLKSEQLARMDDRRRALRGALDCMIITPGGHVAKIIAADDKAAKNMPK